MNESVIINSLAGSPYNSPNNKACEKSELSERESKLASSFFPSLKPGVELGKNDFDARALFNSNKKNTQNLMLGVGLDDGDHKLILNPKSKGQRRNASSLMTSTTGLVKQQITLKPSSD